MSILGIILLLAAVAGTIYFGYGAVVAVRDSIRKKRDENAGKKK